MVDYRGNRCDTVDKALLQIQKMHKHNKCFQPKKYLTISGSVVTFSKFL